MLDKYPYQNYKKAKIEVMERDDYTCQVCGFKPPKRTETLTYCKVCNDMGFYFEPIGYWMPPRPCKFIRKVKKCSDCIYFRKVEVTVPPLIHDIGKITICFSCDSLLAHHLDGEPRNNDLSNLLTVCRSCNRRLVGKSKGWKGVEEVKKALFRQV